ncbi:hypothetical protein BH10BDE1_BH10BDE1_25740 [soil metagenome]
MSGSGAVTVTRPKVQVELRSNHKIPMRGDERSYADSISAWEAATQKAAEELTSLLEKLPSAYRSKIEFLADEFNSQTTMSELDSEGAVSRSSSTDGPHYRLVLHPLQGRQVHGGYVTVSFVLKTKPPAQEVRKLAFDVEATVRKFAGIEAAKAFEPYGVYWLVGTAEPRQKSILFSKEALAQLAQKIADEPSAEMGYATFRKWPAFVIQLQENGKMKKNKAGFLLANPTAAKFDENFEEVQFQINGSMLPAFKIIRATRDEILKVIETPVEDSKKDIEFLESIQGQISS